MTLLGVLSAAALVVAAIAVATTVWLAVVVGLLFAGVTLFAWATM